MNRLHRPGGVFRRRLIIDANETGRVQAGVEDDFHHFLIDLRHDSQVVTGIEATGVRVPFTTCPGAAVALQDFVGQKIGADIIRRRGVTEVTTQCTHMHDLAVLAIARAARGPGRTTYDIAVADREGRTKFPEVRDGILYRLGEGGADGTTTATLKRDGAPVLRWDMDGESFTAPAEISGLDFRQVGKWALQFDDETLEAVKVLRQGVFVSGGRAIDNSNVAGPGFQTMGAVCHSFSPPARDEGRTVWGSRRDWTDNPDGPLADFVAG